MINNIVCNSMRSSTWLICFCLMLFSINNIVSVVEATKYSDAQTIYTEQFVQINTSFPETASNYFDVYLEITTLLNDLSESPTPTQLTGRKQLRFNLSSSLESLPNDYLSSQDTLQLLYETSYRYTEVVLQSQNSIASTLAEQIQSTLSTNSEEAADQSLLQQYLQIVSLLIRSKLALSRYSDGKSLVLNKLIPIIRNISYYSQTPNSNQPSATTTISTQDIVVITGRSSPDSISQFWTYGSSFSLELSDDLVNQLKQFGLAVVDISIVLYNSNPLYFTDSAANINSQIMSIEFRDTSGAVLDLDPMNGAIQTSLSLLSEKKQSVCQDFNVATGVWEEGGCSTVVTGSDGSTSTPSTTNSATTTISSITCNCNLASQFIATEYQFVAQPENNEGPGATYLSSDNDSVFMTYWIAMAVVIICLLACCAVGMALYYRRKNQQDEEKLEMEEQPKPVVPVSQPKEYALDVEALRAESIQSESTLSLDHVSVSSHSSTEKQKKRPALVSPPSQEDEIQLQRKIKKQQADDKKRTIEYRRSKPEFKEEDLAEIDVNRLRNETNAIRQGDSLKKSKMPMAPPPSEYKPAPPTSAKPPHPPAAAIVAPPPVQQQQQEPSNSQIEITNDAPAPPTQSENPRQSLSEKQPSWVTRSAPNPPEESSATSTMPRDSISSQSANDPEPSMPRDSRGSVIPAPLPRNDSVNRQLSFAPAPPGSEQQSQPQQQAAPSSKKDDDSSDTSSDDDDNDDDESSSTTSDDQ